MRNVTHVMERGSQVKYSASPIIGSMEYDPIGTMVPFLAIPSYTVYLVNLSS